VYHYTKGQRARRVPGRAKTKDDRMV